MNASNFDYLVQYTIYSAIGGLVAAALLLGLGYHIGRRGLALPTDHCDKPPICVAASLLTFLGICLAIMNIVVLLAPEGAALYDVLK